MRKVTQRPLHSVLRGVWPRFVSFEPGYNVGISVRNCTFTIIRTTANITYVSGDKTLSLPVTADANTRNCRLQSGKPCRYTLQEFATCCSPPVSFRSKCVTRIHSRRVKVSGPDAPSSIALETCPKTSSCKVDMAVVGPSGVTARLNARLSGVSPTGYPCRRSYAFCTTVTAAH